jgi:triosephosphate isomerase
MRRLLIAGNWKMYKTVGETQSFLHELRLQFDGSPTVEALICPPFTSLPSALSDRPSWLAVGAQNMHPAQQGAFTGEISPAMLTDLGCQYVILGHSERRHVFGESDTFIREKIEAALAAGLVPILCVGETLTQRVANQTESAIAQQLISGLKGLSFDAHHLVIAYEPVWAIGTGKVATPDQAQDVHAFIRKTLSTFGRSHGAAKLRILYGGSVKPDNVAQLLSKPDIDGALVGGASLAALDFATLIRTAETLSKS